MRPTWPLLLMTGLQGLSGGMLVTMALLGLTLGSHALSLGAWSLMSLTSLALVGAGGTSSIFHMHRLAGARLVMRRLRTSWLSREVLTTTLLGLATACTALIPRLFSPAPDWYLPLAIAAASLALVALFVTAMIYATIPAMLSWHSPLTVVTMMGTGLLGGAVWADAEWLLAGPRSPVASAVLAGLLRAALILWSFFKILQFRTFAEARTQIRAETGFGLSRSPHRLLDTGTTRAPYRTQTQVWPPIGRARRHVLQGVLAALGLALFILVGMKTSSALLAAAIAVTLLTYVERWLFFADATHSSLVWFPAPYAEAVQRGERTRA